MIEQKEVIYEAASEEDNTGNTGRDVDCRDDRMFHTFLRHGFNDGFHAVFSSILGWHGSIDRNQLLQGEIV